MSVRVRSPLSLGEKSDILDWFAAKPERTIKMAAIEFGRSEESIRVFLKSMRPTTTLARATLLAKSAELVNTVIDKADVNQIIEVLSRPNVGVLDAAPTSKGGGGNFGIGIAVSVLPGSLPAVNETEFIEGQQRRAAELQPVGGNSKRLAVDNTVVAEIYRD